MGLLSIASHLDENPKQGLAFSDFILKYNFKCCALLEKKSNNYLVTNSIGFDGKSIAAASSTSDFWNGICPEQNQILNFSQNDNSHAPLLQLFSLNMKDSVKAFSLCRSDNKILLVCNDKISEEALSDFPKIGTEKHKCSTDAINKLFTESSVLLKFQINLSEAVESFILAQKIPDTEKQTIENSLYNEFYNRFICIYNNKDASCYEQKSIINTVFILDKTYSTELILNHLIINFRDILENYADIAKISNLGKAQTYREIADFLQAN